MGDCPESSEAQLQGLPPERLLAHHNEMRGLGCTEDARRALEMLIWQYGDRVRYWVERSVPEQNVEDVVGDAFANALRSAERAPFAGGGPGRFGAWLRRIARNTIADYWRTVERRVEEGPLPEEHEGGEEIWGRELAEHGRKGDAPLDPGIGIEERLAAGEDAERIRELIGSALPENPVHRRTIELAGPIELGFAGLAAKRTAEQVNDQLSDRLNDPMTDGNVHQILSRFRRRLGQLYRRENPEAQGD